jgi:hypothetical protein
MQEFRAQAEAVETPFNRWLAGAAHMRRRLEQALGPEGAAEWVHRMATGEPVSAEPKPSVPSPPPSSQPRRTPKPKATASKPLMLSPETTPTVGCPKHPEAKPIQRFGQTRCGECFEPIAVPAF